MSSASVPIQNTDIQSVSVSRAYSTFEPKSLYPIPIVMLGKIAPGWMLLKQMTLSLERDTDGSYVVSDDIFYMFGQGITAVDCVRDYLSSLIEYYNLLSRA